MEKMMFFGLAILFAMMTAVPPRPVERPHKPVPADYPHANYVVTPIEPQPVIDNASKPNKIPVKAEFVYRPE